MNSPCRVDHDVGGDGEEGRRGIEGVADEGGRPLAISQKLEKAVGGQGIVRLYQRLLELPDCSRL